MTPEPAVIAPVVTAGRDPHVGGAPGLGRAAPPTGRARRLVTALPRPHTVLRRHDDVAAVLTRLYAATVAGRETVHVLQLTAPHARDLALELATAGRLLDATPSYCDLTGARSPVAPAPRGPGPVIAGLRTERVDGAALRVLRRASACVVVCETARGDDRLLADTADLIHGLDIAVIGLVIHDGSIPRAG